MVKSIRLRPEYGEEIRIDVFPGKWTYRIEDVINSKARVYENRRYSMFVDTEENIASLSIYLNGERINTILVREQGCFALTESSRLFQGQLGFAQFVLCINSPDGEERWYYSDFASIMVKSSDRSQAVSKMLKYIYDNQSIAIQGEQSVTLVGDDASEHFDDFWSQLQLLEEIAGVYERNYGYFKANARYKLEPVERVDRVEKLQSIDPKTLAYIIQHPDLLRREMTGIKHGRQSFLPSKTLMFQNQMTLDIYENQVIQGFLKKVLMDARDLAATIDHLLSSLTYDNEEDDGYIISSELLFQNARDVLVSYKDRVITVQDKLSYYYVAYKQLLDLNDMDILHQPEPTAIFMNVPQYSQIYSCIDKWFGKKGYKFDNELALLNFFSIPEIYEIYVFLKMIDCIKMCGFEVVDKSLIKYAMEGKYFKPRKYQNYYRFAREDIELSLYYEPVITDDGFEQSDVIGLYRNNTISFAGDNSSERRQHIYTPDYIIKIQDGSKKTRYVICDAKYSYPEKIRNSLVPELTFKYLFSISPKDEESKVAGMSIFFGISNEQNFISSIYDRENQNPIRPFAQLVPFSERMEREEMVDMFSNWLKDILDGKHELPSNK